MSKKDNPLKEPYLEETMPHQINSPSFKGSKVKMQPPFINEQGVVIGDSLYNSEESPLNNWSEEVDPEVMAGDQWVHPTNDIGWNSTENRELIEKQKKPQGVPFTHPDKDVSYGRD
ncbi:DUF3905 domain-containing protein [Sutcliffiella rhizosphaerae]|uniref:DUF3905 domain-containing protein n=1 Tax=Sutcliffiella rhizosphaerae TaxID=2880967 RepID=A0ABN8A9A2_9BACI|nr:DUF3905 domain-containing protein [Sutcliffiella rhizosphaerae]CAG9620537.1 hypothetical protein BACCIP111883_01306 [Sutcliffiella rhizosphaerae]